MIQKRKVRNYVELKSRDMEDEEQKKYKLFIEERLVLNKKIQRAYIALDQYTEGTPKQQEKAAQWMQANFYDLRSNKLTELLKSTTGIA